MLRKASECHFPLLHLLIVGLACARIVEVSEVTREKKVSFDESSSGNQYAVRETTTVASLKTVDSNSRKLTPIVVEALPRNGTNVFRPSVHLGEIEQSKSRTSFPFNNVPHVRFEGNLQYERSQDVLQDTYQGVSGLLDEATRPSRIKFQDDGAVRTPSIHHPFDVQQAVTESTGAQVEDAKHSFVDQTYFQNTERPEMQDTSAIFGKATRSPYVISYHVNSNPSVYQPMSHEMSFEMIKKPDSDDVLVVQQESTYTRKHKFPYPFYQPGSEHYMQFVDEPRYSTHLQMRRLSPWKKIIHLIGTFLPLGLLLATLTPNVVRINNTTQPSIVLSKLRAADLPVEHKQARSLEDQSSTVCEDRSICELILAGGEPESNILQNILWNLATRTSDNVAKRNGLREIFSAVKKKNCMTIKC